MIAQIVTLKDVLSIAGSALGNVEIQLKIGERVVNLHALLAVMKRVAVCTLGSVPANVKTQLRTGEKTVNLYVLLDAMKRVAVCTLGSVLASARIQQSSSGLTATKNANAMELNAASSTELARIFDLIFLKSF